MRKFTTKISFMLIALFITTLSFAQGDFGGDPEDANPLDEPTAPIGDYIWVVAIIGMVYVFYRMNNKKATTSI